MTSGWYGSGGMDPFEEMLARFFGARAHRRPVERISLARLMSEPARELVRDAAAQAAQWGSVDLDTDHLLWAATRQQGTRHWMERAGADPDKIKGEIEDHARRGEPRDVPPELTPSAKRALLDSHQVSRALGSSYIGPEHLLFALALDRGSSAGRILDAAHVTPDSLQSAAAGGGPGQPPGGAGGGQATGTPTLDEFGRDLTALAREGRIDPVIGRGDEIEETVEVLSRRTKNNPVLIGDPGVGKTAIAEGLAQKIVDDDVPETLRGKRIVQLDLGGVVAGTRYRGDFEERLKKVVDEIRDHADELVVFIDEVHTIVGAGGAEGAVSAGNMLKPPLSRGELHVVGATTIDEYRRNIEKDAALERRFQPILVPEPSPDDSVEILRGLRDRYEAHHQVRFSDEALVAAVDLSSRYLTDRFLPDKAIDLIDQAGARVRLRAGTRDGGRRELEQRLDRRRREKDQAVADEDYEKASELRDEIGRLEQELAAATRDDGGATAVPEVTTEDIAEVVSRISGVPVTQLTQAERERLTRLEEHLHERVIGQEDAVAAVARAVRRSRAGMGDPDRPIGGFLFLGPTGVGKTELAKALAEALFGSRDRLVRFDMSEFQERHTVSRLMGAPPGYVGYEEAGQLTDAVRRQPYSVILLDEIEKAHQDVFNVLLQLLDDGRLTDAQGRTVDFRNTVVIMTSNLGSELITGRTEIGFGTPGGGPDTAISDRIMRRLRESFRPEFLNRIDEIIVFQRLEQGQLRQITDLLLDETRRRLRAQDVDVDFTTEAVDWIAERGYQPEFGARPLRRTIQRQVDDQLSDLLLAGDLRHGSRVEVSAANGGLEFRVATEETA